MNKCFKALVIVPDFAIIYSLCEQLWAIVTIATRLEHECCEAFNNRHTLSKDNLYHLK